MTSISSRRIALAIAVAVSACGGRGRDAEPAPAAATPRPSVAYFHVDPATAGRIHGTVTYRGAKPAATMLLMSAEPTCEAIHKGKPVPDGQLVVGPGGGLANVFVYIKSGLQGKKFEPSKAPVVLDQEGCMFVPRVVGVQAGAPLAVRNGDPLEHNVHPGPKNNYEWNEGMAPSGPDVIHKFARQEVMIRVKCNVHPWMRAWIGVVEHPYFAVTGADGTFELTNVPPGDYTVAVWHEQFGELTAPVALDASSTRTLGFAYPGSGEKEK